MLLIINADDLGASQGINDEIFELMSLGLVTSATIMANAPAFEHAVSRMKEFPACSFGVHLNLTAFTPLSTMKGMELILDEYGHLSPILFKISINSAMREVAFRELTMQVTRAIDAGVQVSHFDSHQHVHTIPQLFPIFKCLQRTFGIKKVRSSISLLSPGDRMSAARSLKKWVFANALRHFPATQSPEGLGDFKAFYMALKSGRCPSYPRLELMVHPGTPVERYREEIAMLRSDWRAFLPEVVRLGSYHSF
jgi:predicted glycoside hydrolase/deacetylase ChbG (UPF0249 family)